MHAETSHPHGPKFWGGVVIVACALFALYNVLIVAGKISAADSSAVSNFEDNYIRAETYAVETSSRPTPPILVGSSRVAAIRQRFFANGAVNLGMGGGNARTGLRIIRDAGRSQDRVILVGLDDTLLNAVDGKMLDELFKEPQHSLRKWFPALRTAYRPTSVAVSLLKQWQINRQSANPRDADTVIAPEVRERMLNDRRASDAKPLSAEDSGKFREAVLDLKTDVDALRSRGLRVIFFTPPSENEADHSLRQGQLTDLFQSVLPPSSYEWMPYPNDHAWVTSDGLHLSRTSAREFASLIEAFVATPPSK